MGPIRQVHTDVLNIGYYEAGPGDGRVVLLLHGYPYDIHSYVAVAPMLAAQGYRVIVPTYAGMDPRALSTPSHHERAAGRDRRGRDCFDGCP
jgi:pimeloyl-ACP methyl ester carboxylesterase